MVIKTIKNNKQKKQIQKEEKNTLNFYILRRKKETCSWDEMCQCIVYAIHPKQARSIAQRECLDECHDDKHDEHGYWTDPRKTTCHLLSSVYKHESKPQMVLAETIDA